MFSIEKAIIETAKEMEKKILNASFNPVMIIAMIDAIGQKK
jgi:hypothetical protein